ncbi:Piso0_002663 [Millerozyma farinosa CBS 7064]|uniref:Piso0_002663 protein n=1 Tax=Pichia sorbitophila (strain ATCC MYA-4447 / BCRC 22081 / CBS 7064 / NBRC 10061 / NRRL Y-12695) TaxID=559304 RepID=G8YD73_PICSO|nr:Piso0_002663 [Millerozyma farinosa CBS 7064]
MISIHRCRISNWAAICSGVPMCHDAFQAISFYVSLLSVSTFISYTKDHLATIVNGTSYLLQQKVDLDSRLISTMSCDNPAWDSNPLQREPDESQTRARRSATPFATAFQTSASGKVSSS